jgi:hypothetical protein
MNAQVTAGDSDEDVAGRFLRDAGLMQPMRLDND